MLFSVFCHNFHDFNRHININWGCSVLQPIKNRMLMISLPLPQRNLQIPRYSILTIPSRKLHNILGQFVQIQNGCYLIVKHLCQICLPSTSTCMQWLRHSSTFSFVSWITGDTEASHTKANFYMTFMVLLWAHSGWISFDSCCFMWCGSRASNLWTPPHHPMQVGATFC